MRISTVIVAFALLLAVGASGYVVNAGPDETPAAVAKATVAEVEAAGRKAVKAFGAQDFTALGDMMPNWRKERVDLEFARTKAKIERVGEVDAQIAAFYTGENSLDPANSLKITNKTTLLGLSRTMFFALDSGFLRVLGTKANQAAAGGEWFMVGVEEGLMAATRPSTIVQTTQHATLVTFENTARDFAAFAFCAVDGRWMLCGWEISIAGMEANSSRTGQVAAAISLYDDSKGRLAEPVAEATVTHILVKVGDTAKGSGGKRSVEEAKTLCEELWKKYLDTPEEDKAKVWKAMQVEYNEDGMPHNEYQVTARAQLIQFFKDVALTTDVGKARIAPYDKKGSPYGFHLIRREK